MKRMLEQKLIDKLAELVDAQGVEWVSQMKDLISYDEEMEMPSIFDLRINDVLYITSISDIHIPEDDKSFFPELTDQAGKVVVVNEDETGFEYAENITPKLTNLGNTDTEDLTITNCFCKGAIINDGEQEDPDITLTLPEEVEVCIITSGGVLDQIMKGNSQQPLDIVISVGTGYMFVINGVIAYLNEFDV